MISTKFKKGQGLGNQLWCYAVARCIAKDKGCSFGISQPEDFVGKGFMDLDMGEIPVEVRRIYMERAVIHPLNGSDIRGYDAGVDSVADGTELEGLMQDERYIERHRDEIRKWFQIKPEYDCRDYSSDDICVINFRGGGYVFDVDFFLPRRYWRHAIAHMRATNPHFRFVVVTDDPKTAKKFFPDFEVHHWSIGKDYAVIKNAKHLILSNSSFAFFPAWLSTDLKSMIAPKYWGRHNISDGYWSLGYNLYKGWDYLDRKGKLQSYEECKEELDSYMAKNADIYSGSIAFRQSVPVWTKNNTRIFLALRRDIGVIPASLWLMHARGLRAAIWVKDTTDRLVKKCSKDAKRLLKKALRLPGLISDMIEEHAAKRSWMPPAAIAEYKKRIKIYDVFTFFNELDLLEIRLDILGPYVDHFVIVEAPETYSGNPKPLYFKENRKRYARWDHKIIYHQVDRIPVDEDDLRRRLDDPELDHEEKRIIGYTLSTDIIDHSKDYWVKEFYIKESVRVPLAGLRDDDICYVSDLDEIWDPNLVIDYSKDDIFRLRQLPYMYYLNNRSDEDWRGWSGTIVTKYKNIRMQSLNHIRTHKDKVHSVPLRHGGWHFSFQGGAGGARRKIEESDHPFYKAMEALPGLDDKIAKNADYRGRNIKLWVDENGLPRYLIENKERWRRFFKQ